MPAAEHVTPVAFSLRSRARWGQRIAPTISQRDGDTFLGLGGAFERCDQPVGVRRQSRGKGGGSLCAQARRNRATGGASYDAEAKRREGDSWAKRKSI